MYRITVLPAKKILCYKYIHRREDGKAGRDRFETSVFKMHNDKYHKPLKQSATELIASLKKMHMDLNDLKSMQ